MDFPTVPPIPPQTHTHSRHRSIHRNIPIHVPSTSRAPSRSRTTTPTPRPPMPTPQFAPRSDSLAYRHGGATTAGETRPRKNLALLIAPASPDVLDSLIDSFAVIQKPVEREERNAHSLGGLKPAPHLATGGMRSAPLLTPHGFREFAGGSNDKDGEHSLREKGSFGVDYGAFRQPSKEELRAAFANPLSDLSAAPPIIKTSKPPSGYSSLTAPKSLAHKDSSGGLKALLRSSSRPSSRSSNNSRDDHSIGAISIDQSGTPDLHRSRSTDSWGRKGRGGRGLMYMSSKERLREADREREKKRASLGAQSSGTSPEYPHHSASSPMLRPSGPLAEIAIREEGGSPTDEERGFHLSWSPGVPVSLPDIASPRQIPTRESSLRRTPGRRSSTRGSRRRESEDGSRDREGHKEREGERSRDEIPEHVVPDRRHKRGKSSLDADILRRGTPEAYSGRESPAISNGRRTPLHRRVSDSFRPQATVEEDIITTNPLSDDSAPFPAVAQNRRRDDSSMDRLRKRRSGQRYSSDVEGLKQKRSSSRLKRLSASGLSSFSSPRVEDTGQSSKDVRAKEKEEKKRASEAELERPASADSIDDAVESYLCSPRLSQKICHPQTGRIISFSEVGDSEGSAVFCCVGMGLTRYITAFYDELALTLKLRLITPDRPGVGDSEAYNDGTTTPLSWPDDVYAICQALRISSFSILAHSAGAIYALATALRMPQHIRGRIHLLAPWIPPSQMNVFGTSQALPPTNAIPTAQRILRALPTPFLSIANSSFMTATSSSITSSLPKGQKKRGRRTAGRVAEKEREMNGLGVLANGVGVGASNGDGLAEEVEANTKVLTAAFDAIADKERQAIYDERLTHSIWELATTGANPAVDLLVCLERRHTIGFRYVDITRPVVIHHGSRDTRVPVDNVRWLGKTMRRCEVRVLEGEGHGLMASASVMGGVLMEIAKEWDDWMRAAGEKERERERGRR